LISGAFGCIWLLIGEGGDSMKGLFTKVMGVIAGLIAFSGISVANVKASVPNAPASLSGLSEKPLLYLEHGKSLGGSIDTRISQHWSHSSHSSHASHSSHSSGY